jgi:hypothetical protein
MYTDIQGLRFKILETSKDVYLYHGTSRLDSFIFPKINKDKKYAPFSWFTNKIQCAERYAGLDIDNILNGGLKRVLIYNTISSYKMLDLRDEETFENYKLLFCDKNPKFLNMLCGGKHSIVYRLINIPWMVKHNGSLLKHTLTLKKLGVIGFIEKGVEEDSIDFVFFEDLDNGADKWLHFLDFKFV